MRCHDCGSLYTVTVTAREVHAFKAEWPCSGLPDARIWFQFDARTGDLVDIGPYRYAGRIDGDAAVALSEDACRYGARRLGLADVIANRDAASACEPHDPQTQYGRD